MKKLFSLLAMAAMVFTACQNDEGVKNPTLADEGIVNLSVGVPELATRALDGDNQFGADSAYGAIDYANYTSFLENEYDVRFQLAVYEAGAAEDAEPVYTATNYVDFASTTDFSDLRFVPGREYQFVIFADFVLEGSQEDFRYNTADLRNITTVGNSKLNAMDETYDAYFFNETIKVEAGKVNELEATLKRPFGKIRVLTTDYEWVRDYATPVEGTVTFYNHAIYKSFNALTGEVATEATNDEESLTYAIDDQYYGATMYEGNEALTLFATYILGNEWQEAVNFRLDTFEEDGSLIKSLDFNTEIPYQRNHLTTLVGNLLTNEADLFVRIDDNFDAEHFEKGDFENVENGLKWIREGELVGGQVYSYETNLFSFRLLSDTDGTDLREGKYDYTEELPYIQNATGFDVNGIDVEKGTLTITKRGTRAGNFYDVVFDIYATIDGKTENYILTWNGELKGAREPLAVPVVTYEVDEIEHLDIIFSWEAVENAANYTVKWNEEEQTVEGTSATFNFSGEDTYATASVTANPANADDYTASTGYVTVDWKKPIVYSEVPVLLGYHDGEAVQFYTAGVKINLNKYPSLEEAVLILDGETTVFSNEATIEVSATGVVITEPARATKYVYTGSMEIYELTDAKVKWGADAVEIAFTGEDAAITVATSVPLTEGLHTVDPSYVMVEGTTPNVDNIKATMNVILKNGVYTVFFNVAVTSSIQKGMQYVGAIDFEKPYAPEYKLTSYEARENTIYFEGEGVKYEIEATSLESGDVVVKYIAIENNQMEITAATAVVTEKDGVYDARYTLPLGYTNPFTGKDTFDLQYVGPFVPYSAPVEPEKPIEFEATYEVKAGAYFFTGVNYNFSIIVNKLGTTEYITGETEDGWYYDWNGALDAYRNNFRTGDFLTVENNVVTLEFTAAPLGEEHRYKMTCDMNEEPAQPEEITVQLALENGLYVSDNYKIDYYQGAAVVYVQNVAAPNNMIANVTVYDDADELVFEFVDEYNNVNVTAIYTKNAVTPATDVEVQLTLENGIYYGLYETTVYSISAEDGIAHAEYADGSKDGYVCEMSENTTFIVFTFNDPVNNVNVTALYQKTNAPAEPVYDNLTILKDNERYSDSKYGYEWYYVSEAGYYGYFYVANGKNTSELVEGEYTWHASYADAVDAPGFTVTMRDANKAIVIVTSASLKVEGKVVYLTVNENYFKGEIATVEPGPGTDEPEDEWTNLTETAELGKVGSFTVYKSATYQLAGGDWQEIGNISNAGKYETEETATGYIFTFDDEVNFRHVTITYTEAGSQPEGPVTYDPWACTAEMEGTYQNATIVLKGTGENTDEIKVAVGQLVGNREYSVSEVTVNGNVVSAEGTLTVEDARYTVIFNITANGKTYKGQSADGIL